jgi:hypothetical protein
MKHHPRSFTQILTVAGALACAGPAFANTTITTFDNFTSDALYPSWALPSATVVSGPTAYSITATGYGSNYKYIGFPAINGAGNTHLELTVSLSGAPAADGNLGPIIELIDGDGTDFVFAWFGQTLGSHVLTKSLDSPSWANAPGSAAGLDLATLTHMHMQLDPGAYGSSGPYTVVWENLSLITIPEPSSLALLTLGAAGLLIARRRRA